MTAHVFTRLFGDGKQGQAERIQTFRGPACHTTFSARRHTPLYRLKTPSQLFCHLHLPRLQLDELRTRLRCYTQVLWLAIDPLSKLLLSWHLAASPFSPVTAYICTSMR